MSVEVIPGVVMDSLMADRPNDVSSSFPFKHIIATRSTSHFVHLPILVPSSLRLHDLNPSSIHPTSQALPSPIYFQIYLLVCLHFCFILKTTRLHPHPSSFSVYIPRRLQPFHSTWESILTTPQITAPEPVSETKAKKKVTPRKKPVKKEAASPAEDGAEGDAEPTTPTPAKKTRKLAAKKTKAEAPATPAAEGDEAKGEAAVEGESSVKVPATKTPKKRAAPKIADGEVRIPCPISHALSSI